jgi:hypothetical protein
VIENEFTQELEIIAGKVTGVIEGFRPEDSITVWDLKLKLKVGLSPLYMALGLLQERGRIRLSPDGLTYRVQSTAEPKPSQPVVGIPIQIPVPSGEPASSKTS